MKLQNIYSRFADIYITVRNGKNLEIKEIKGFFPYIYEPDPNGKFLGYDGVKLTKIHCKAPHEIKKIKTDRSYEADVHYTKRYIIDEIKKFEKSETKFFLYDIEVKAEKEFPEANEAKFPVTFITLYDNHSNSYRTWDYREFKTEYDMLTNFCEFIRKEKPDVLLAWNQDEFDYPYLYNRYPGFAKAISPIGEENYKGIEKIPHPALISVVDIMALDHKFTGGKRSSYALDNVCLEEFEDEETWGEQDWSNDDEVKEKNINDVKRMIRLVNKNQYIEIFDSIRIFSKCLWEDLPSEKDGWEWKSNNSKPWDMLFLQLAKDLGVVLPSKPRYEMDVLEMFKKDVRYKRDGAYRETFQKGVFISDMDKTELKRLLNEKH